MSNNLKLLAVLACAGVILWSAASWSHDIYSDWKMPDNPSVSCCGGQDCRRVRAWTDQFGNWYVENEGHTLQIPKDKFLPFPSPDGNSHWCGSGMVTYCFVPGEPKS